MGEVIHFAFRPPKKTGKGSYNAAAEKQHADRTKDLVVNSPDDVKNLPWRGNFRDDEHLHRATDEYMRRERNPFKQHQANRHANKLGMGEDLPEKMSPDVLAYYRSLHED